jgi:hypothetical protein
MSAGGNAEGWLEKRLVAESASAAMYASAKTANAR